MCEPPVCARKWGECFRTSAGMCAHMITCVSVGCTEASAAFARGGSKGQLALGVTIPRPLGSTNTGSCRLRQTQARPQTSGPSVEPDGVS